MILMRVLLDHAILEEPAILLRVPAVAAIALIVLAGDVSRQAAT